MFIIQSIGATGPTDDTGSTGPAVGTMIPFACDKSITPRTNTAGELNRTNVIGFGSATGNVAVEKVTTEDPPLFRFTLDENADFITFPMPYDGKITTVAGRYSTVTPWTAPCDMSLYIAVAIAPRDSNVYTIIPASKALAPVYEKGVSNPDRAVRTGVADGLDLEVKQGENIAVVAGYENSNGPLNQLLPFNYTGSLVIVKD